MALPYRDSFPSDHDDLLRYSSFDHLFFPTTPQASSSSSSLSFPSLFPTGLDHSNLSDDPHPLELKHKDIGGIMACKNNDQTIGNDEDHVETGLRITIWKQIEKSESSSCCDNNNNNNHHNHNHNNNDLVKWSSSSSSSNIRLVINSNQTETTVTQSIDAGRNFQDLNRTSSPSDQTNKRSMLNDGGGAIIRTCSDCNTTKTPLWRSGPRGPKSLCNACGIRQRKARRAMAEAAAANGGKPAAVVLKTNKAVQHKIMNKPAAAAATTSKRKCKDVVVGATAGGGGRKKICFEEMKIGSRLSEISSSYQRVFPQDEREAAILLMTLSYGLLHG